MVYASMLVAVNGTFKVLALSKYHSRLYVCSARFKESLAEFSQLFQSFPAIGDFVLELPILKQWHSLGMADHIPAEQCLRALIPKLKDVKEAHQVSGWYVL